MVDSAASPVLEAYVTGSLALEDLAGVLVGLPEEDLGEALVDLYARMRGVPPGEAAREIHRRMLEAEVFEILEEMAENGDLERVSTPEANPTSSRPDDPGEEAWLRFASVVEATQEAARRGEVLPRPGLGPRRRLLRGAEFARCRGVDYSTVWKWRKHGLLPEARGGGAIGAPVLIPGDATVLDRDLAAEHPPGLALVLHWYRHARSDADRGCAIVRATQDLPDDQTASFLGVIARWREEAGRAPSEEEITRRREGLRERYRRAELVPPLVNLRELRQEGGLTQQAFAERIGKSQAAVSELEKRAELGRSAQRGIAEDLARGLGVSPEDLWTPRGRPARRYLSARAFAHQRGEDVETVRGWLRDGRLPEAVPTRKGANRLIPEDAHVVDRDLARDHPGPVALLLHRFRHAAPGHPGDSERARIVEGYEAYLRGER